MKMTHSNLERLKKSATVSLIMFPLLVTPLLLVTAFSIICVVARRNHSPCPLSHSTPTSRKRCMLLSCWSIIMRKNLMMMKQKSFSSTLFPRNTFKTMFAIVNAISTTRLLKTLKISFRVTLTLTHPRKMIVRTIVKMTEASPLVITASCSPLMMMPTHHQIQILHCLVVPLNILAIVLIPFLIVMPVRHASTTLVVSVKIALSSGLSVPCITLPLDLKLQRTLVPYANWLKHNHMIPIQLLVFRPCHHVMNVNLILCTMLMTAIGQSVVALAVALAATPHPVHPVVIFITMITAAANPLVHTMTTTSDIMISLLILQNHFLIVKLESIVVLTAPLSCTATVCPNAPVSLMFMNLLVHPTSVTILLHHLERSMNLPGTPTPTTIPTILFILTGLVTVTTPTPIPTLQLMQITMMIAMTANLIVVVHLPSHAGPVCLPLMSETLPILKQNSTVIGITLNLMHNPQLG